MKLFYQLTEEEQDTVLNHCVDNVLSDMIKNGVEFNAETAKDAELKEYIEHALSHLNEMKTDQEKIDFLMNDETISSAVFSIAIEMCKSAYFHEDDEMVIFYNSLGDDEPPKLAASNESDKKLN